MRIRLKGLEYFHQKSSTPSIRSCFSVNAPPRQLFVEVAVGSPGEIDVESHASLSRLQRETIFDRKFLQYFPSRLRLARLCFFDRLAQKRQMLFVRFRLWRRRKVVEIIRVLEFDADPYSLR